jgi:uncharacterized protein (TIGR02996 family)
MAFPDAFLATILERPDDDGPRMVYADWLEENGRTEQAEFIRLQLAGQDPDRTMHLAREHGTRWAGPIAKHVYSFGFHRGFVEEVTISAAGFVMLAEGLFRYAPIRLARIIGAGGALKQLVRVPQLANLRALHLTDCHIGDAGAHMLARCDLLLNLTSLRLGNNLIGDEGVEELANSRILTKLDSLVLRRNLVSDNGARWLATSDSLRNLSNLDLAENLIGESGARAFAASDQLTNLRHFDLSGQYRGDGLGNMRLRGRPSPLQPKHQQALAERFGPQVCVF